MSRDSFRTLSLAVALLAVTLFPLLSAAEESAPKADWQNTARRVLELAGEMDIRTGSSARYEQEDREALSRRLAELQKHIGQTEQQLADTRQELETQSARRAELADRYRQEMADMKTVEGMFRTALKGAVARLSASPVSSQHPERLATLTELAQGDLFMDIGEVRSYADLLFADMEATGQFEEGEGRVKGLDGSIDDQRLIRAGGFFLGYTDGETGVFALPRGILPAESIPVRGAAEKQIKAWMAGQLEIVPVDITGGTAFKAIREERGFREWLEAGGVLLYPILLAGLIGLLVAALKSMQLFLQHRLPEKLRNKVFNALEQGEETAPLLEKKRFCPAARVMIACLGFRGRGLDAIDSAMEEAIMREQSRLDRYLSAVGVLATISPLLGLLGTVTGMIDTFQAITVYGTGDPRMMSTGISEALVTTQAGLGIALPLLLLHHFLKRRVASLVADMEEAGSGITAQLSAR